MAAFFLVSNTLKDDNCHYPVAGLKCKTLYDITLCKLGNVQNSVCHYPSQGW
jgi:hypothetical protein